MTKKQRKRRKLRAKGKVVPVKARTYKEIKK